MSKVFLITRPFHDTITSYLHSFSNECIKKIKETKDIHVTDLEGSNATRIMFENKISMDKPKLIFLNGHGDSTTVCGHNNEPILDEKNAKITKNKIVYALACDSLADLGKISVENYGAIAYIGYENNFMFIRDPQREGTPLKDKNAAPFKEVCSLLIDYLLAGKSVKDVINKTKETYKKLIKSYGSSADDPYGDVPLIRFALAWDLTFLGFQGDANASF